MEFPVYLWLGPLGIHPHWLFESLAYLVGARLYGALKARQGDTLRPSDRWSVVAAGAVGAAVGGKLLYWTSDPGFTLAHADDLFFLIGGKSIVGSLIGALVAVEWIKRRIGVTQSTGDLFAVPLAVGIAIGRVGCFLTGLDDHTYGLPTSLPWGVDFGDGLARHPTQIYEIAFLLPLALLLAYATRRWRLPAGDLFKLFMVSYFAFRLGLEAIKPGLAFAGLTAIQWSCAAMLVYYAPWAMGALRQREVQHA